MQDEQDSKFRDNLGVLSNLLQKYGLGWQADFVRELLDLQRSDLGKFLESLTGTSMWGGAESVWEIALVQEPRSLTPDEEADRRVYRKAIIGLVDQLEELGPADERMRSVRRFRKAV